MLKVFLIRKIAYSLSENRKQTQVITYFNCVSCKTVSSPFFKVKGKACIHLRTSLWSGGWAGPIWPASLTVPQACWGCRSVVGMPQYGNRGLCSLFGGKYTSTHTVGSANPSYPHAFICSPCPPVLWDLGCLVTQLFLATSITGMCALRAVFSAVTVVRGHGQSLFVLLPPSTSRVSQLSCF